MDGKGRAMAVFGGLLFYRSDVIGLSDVLRHLVHQLRSVVNDLPDRMFANNPDAEIASQVASDQAIAPLAVDFTSAKAAVVETEVEFQKSFGFHGDLTSVPGLKATKSIPFVGDPAIWQFHAGSWSINPPRGEICGETLVIGMSVPTQQADQAAQYIGQTIAQLRALIAQQNALIEDRNASLGTKAMPWILARRQRKGTTSDLLRKLGG